MLRSIVTPVALTLPIVDFFGLRIEQVRISHPTAKSRCAFRFLMPLLLEHPKAGHQKQHLRLSIMGLVRMSTSFLFVVIFKEIF